MQNIGCTGAQRYIVLISDTHARGSGFTLPTVAADILRRADLILHAGDIVGPEVLRYLSSFAPTMAVCGNMDEGSLCDVLPRKLTATWDEQVIGLIHGDRHQDKKAYGGAKRYLDPGIMDPLFDYLSAELPEADTIVFGHLHRPAVVRYGGRLLINPGSASAKAHRRTMGILYISESDPEIVEIR